MKDKPGIILSVLAAGAANTLTLAHANEILAFTSGLFATTFAGIKLFRYLKRLVMEKRSYNRHKRRYNREHKQIRRVHADDDTTL